MPICKMDVNLACQICLRQVPEEYIEKHHLIPNQKKGPTILVCCSCGDQLHQLFNNKELKKNFNSLENILADERVKQWVKWISKKSIFSVCVKSKKRR